MAEADENVLDNDTADKEMKGDGTQDIESQIQLAMRSRVGHFKEQADSLTFESVRRIMEKDLGLETYALDVHKRFIKACLSECLDNVVKDDGPKSAEETVEINMDTTEEKVADLPNKQLTKKEVRDANSDNEDKMEDSPVMGLLKGDEKTKTEDSGKNCNKGIPSEKMIEVAIKKRASYFRDNSDDITMGGARKLLEEDLELEANSLLPFKKFIAGKIDRVLSAPAASKVKPKSKTKEKISNRKVSKNVVIREETSDYSDGEIGKNKKPVQRKINKTAESKKRKRGSKEIEAPSEKKKKKKEAQSSEGNSGKSNDDSASEDNDSASPAKKPTKMKKETEVPAYGKHVENLKAIIKSCGMSVPPAVYRRVKQIPENKREAALIKELKDILSKEGLSSDPSEKEIKDVRKKKERLKELEGIDMSNIVSSTRRRSSTSFPPPPMPKLPVESDSDEGEEDEEDSEDDVKDGEGEDDHENNTDVDNDEASDEEEENEDSD